MITCSIITVSAYSKETLQEKKNLKHLVSLSDRDERYEERRRTDGVIGRETKEDEDG